MKKGTFFYEKKGTFFLRRKKGTLFSTKKMIFFWYEKCLFCMKKIKFCSEGLKKTGTDVWQTKKKGRRKNKKTNKDFSL